MDSIDPANLPPPAADVPLPLPRRADKKPSLRRRALLGAAGLAGAAALTRLARAGELTPPPGPVMPTGSSLGKIDATVASLESKIDTVDKKLVFGPTGIIEPRRAITSVSSSATAQYCITESGAYYLTGNLIPEPGKDVCIEIKADHVDIDGQGFAFLGGGGGGSGGCFKALGRQSLEFYDFEVTGWHGPICDFADCDDVYVSDVLMHACVNPDAGTPGGGVMIRCGDRCGIEDDSISACTGSTVQMGDSSYCFELCVTDSTGGGVRCGSGCCIEASHFIRVTGDVIVTASSCAVTECDIRACDGQAITTGSACVIECVECVGGTGGGFHCADGCCVEDCTVLNKDAMAIECGSRSSITENRVVLCWGMSCDSESCCFDNELSSCSGGPDTAEGLGGAIVLRGAHSTCEQNSVSSSRVGISVHQGASSSLVHENVVVCAGAGSDPVSGPTAGIAFHDGATSCMCTCNHLRAVQGTPPLLPGTCAFGPMAVLSPGDMSLTSPASSHPLANTVMT